MLILDNCSAHPEPERLTKGNFFIMYLPFNCMSLIQPQDNCILCSMKCKYQWLFMNQLVSSANAGIPVQEFIQEFKIKDEVYCVAIA